MNDADDPRPDQFDAVARRLQDEMRDATPVVSDADAATIAAVRQGIRRRRRTRVTAAAAVAALVLLGGLAVVVSRDDGATRGLVVGQPDSMATTDIAPTSEVDRGPDSSSGAPDTSSADPAAPGSTDSSMIDTGRHRTSPTTTIPDPGTTTPTTAPPTGPRDCGSYGPSGWPTTYLYSPSAAQCLIDGFNTGTANTFHEVVADTNYDGTTHDHLITEDYVVVGVHLVQVRVDRTLADRAPKTIVTYRCNQLTYQFGSGQVYQYGGCTVVG